MIVFDVGVFDSCDIGYNILATSIYGPNMNTLPSSAHA